MRPSPPELLKLDAKSLLQDVQDRLADRVAGWSGTPDPTDPAWLLLEEAAWMVELLSEQLNDYPFKVIQQFVHLLGAHLRPARPALGIVVVEPTTAGVLRQSPEHPAPWRFFAPQTEDRDLVEFALLESEAPVLPSRLASLTRLQDGELQRLGAGDDYGAAKGIAWAGEPARSGVFDDEFIEYELRAANPDALLEQVDAAIEALGERRLGWLVLDAARTGTNGVVVTARIDPTAALVAAAEGPVTPGGDLEIDWRTLDGSTWTPRVQVRDHAVVPPFLRGRAPLPGSRDGTLLLADLPGQLELDGLLRRVASPIPKAMLDEIWRNLTYVDTGLAKLRPAIRRRVPTAEEAGEPGWIALAVAGPVWDRLQSLGTATLAEVTIPPKARGPGSARVAVVTEGGQDPGRVHAYGIEADAVTDVALPVREAWSLELPGGGGRGMRRVTAYDVRLGARHESILVVAPGEPAAVLVNAVAVINAPVVQDGRAVEIERAVPESASLRFENLVTPTVIADARQQPLGEPVRAMLDDLPLGRFTLSRGTPVDDYSGIGVDPSAGELTFNAPDAAGRTRRIRPGTEVRLEWYRRTDGSTGDLEAGAIQFVEAPPSAEPSLLGVRNPLATFLGADRETEESAQERLFGPVGDAPVLAADWERAIHVELGERGRDWVVRVWTYGERSLLSHRLWPPLSVGVDEETERLRAALVDAGPDRLLVVLGPEDAVLDDAQLGWARSVVQGLVNRVRRRVPAIRGAVVTRLWPLEWVGGTEGPEGIPAWDVTGAGGVLRDPSGNEAPAPANGVLLNAAAVVIEDPKT